MLDVEVPCDDPFDVPVDHQLKQLVEDQTYLPLLEKLELVLSF